MASTVIQAIQAALGAKDLASGTWEYLTKLCAMLEPDVARFSHGMKYDCQNKFVAVDFSPAQVKKYGKLELLQLTDMQFGHIACRMHRVIEYRDWILAEPNRFMLWTGDNVDAHALWSPGSAWDNVFDPQSQVYRFCEVWAPARHRILGYVGGNHERRAIPGFGDLGILISTLLRIPYSDGQQLVDIKFGGHQPFKIHLWHGRGGGQTKGGLAQKLDKFSRFSDSQLFLTGDLHQAMVVADWRSIRKPGKNDVHIEKLVSASSTSFLSHWGTYGEVKGYRVSDVMMVRTILEPDGKWEVTLR